MVHLAPRLVAVLAADKTGVAVTLVLVHLLPETEHARRKRVPGLHPVALHGLRHHAPVIFHTHRLLDCLGVVVKADAGVQHTRVGHVFRNMGIRGTVSAALGFPVGKVGRSSLVHLVVRLQPGQKDCHGRVGVYLGQRVMVGLREAAYDDKSISAPAATAGNLNTASR